jgi:toxin ParE1/3/4
MQVVRRPKFIDDLADAYAWIATDNPSAADRLLALIAVVISRLQPYPFIGASREELGAGVRSIRVRPFPHLIFYRVDGETITLIRLLHGARDFPSAGIDS